VFDGQEYTRDTEEDMLLMRKVAGDSESIILLKNQDNTLLLQAHRLMKISNIGWNAKKQPLSGNGSAELKPSYFTPYDGIVNELPKGTQVTYEGARGQFDIFLTRRIS